MTRLGLLSLLFLTACPLERLVSRPEDCPQGCFTADGRCVDGRSETACGAAGLACASCAVSDTCVEQTCRSLLVEQSLTWGPRFQSVGQKALASDVTRLTTLQPEDDARAGATPLLYGLRTAARDVVSLGTWDAFGAAVTTVTPAVAPGDEARPGLTFLDFFVGNRRLLMTGYAVDGAHRLFLYSTAPTERPVGTVVELVAGPFTATPIGDFFFLSAPGVMTGSGPGVYGFLDGPSLNSARGIAAYSPVASAGVGLMATAQSNIGLFGSFDTSTGQQRVRACTLAAYMDAYVAAANHSWPLDLQSCTLVYSGGAEVVSLSRAADGFAVLERSASAQALRFVPLLVTGTGAAQTVSAGPVELLADVSPLADVEGMLDYGDDVLVVVRTSAGRTVHRAARR